MKYHVQGYKDYKEAFFAFPFFEDNEKKKKKSIALFFITFLKKSDLITAYNNYYQGLVLHFSECIDLSAFLFPLPISYLYSVLRKEKKKMYSFFFLICFFLLLLWESFIWSTTLFSLHFKLGKCAATVHLTLLSTRKQMMNQAHACLCLLECKM